MEWYLKKCWACFVAGAIIVSLMVLGLCASAQPVNPSNIEPLKIGIAFHTTTNLIFPYAIKSVDRGSSSVLVQKAKGVENILQVKAGKINFETTNLSIVTSDGAFYSFLVDYAASPSALNYKLVSNDNAYPALLAHDPNEKELEESANRIEQAYSFMRYLNREQQVQFGLQGIYLSGDRLWFKLKIGNQSAIDFRTDYMQFIIKDKRKTKRTAIQQTELIPVFTRMEESIPSKSSGIIVAGFEPFTVPRKRQLLVQIGEPGGGRTLTLRVKNRHMLRARIL